MQRSDEGEWYVHLGDKLGKKQSHPRITPLVRRPCTVAPNIRACPSEAVVPPCPTLEVYFDRKFRLRLVSNSDSNHLQSQESSSAILPMGLTKYMYESDGEDEDGSTTTQVQAPPQPTTHPDKPVRALRSGTRRAPKQNSVPSTRKRFVGSSPPKTKTLKQSTLPSEWTVDQVVNWLKSKGFSPDVYDRFIGQSISLIPLPFVS